MVSTTSWGTGAGLPSRKPTKVRYAETHGQVRPVVASSPRTSTNISRDVRNVAVTVASRRTTCPTWIGPSNERSSIPAVMQIMPAKRWEQIAAHKSIHASTCPPKTFPSAFAWVGNTYSVMVVTESIARRGSGEIGCDIDADLSQHGPGDKPA